MLWCCPGTTTFRFGSYLHTWCSVEFHASSRSTRRRRISSESLSKKQRRPSSFPYAMLHSGMDNAPVSIAVGSECQIQKFSRDAKPPTTLCCEASGRRHEPPRVRFL